MNERPNKKGYFFQCHQIEKHPIFESLSLQESILMHSCIHEAGHAILFAAQNIKVSWILIGPGEQEGYTIHTCMTNPDDVERFALGTAGGIAAEILVFKKILDGILDKPFTSDANKLRNAGFSPETSADKAREILEKHQKMFEKLYRLLFTRAKDKGFAAIPYPELLEEGLIPIKP